MLKHKPHLARREITLATGVAGLVEGLRQRLVVSNPTAQLRRGRAARAVREIERGQFLHL